MRQTCDCTRRNLRACGTVSCEEGKDCVMIEKPYLVTHRVELETVFIIRAEGAGVAVATAKEELENEDNEKGPCVCEHMVTEQWAAKEWKD